MVVRKRLNIEGSALVFVTTTVLDWAPIFTSTDMANVALNQLAETTAYHNVRIVGYVLMPTHLHLLLGFENVNKLSPVIQSYKSLSSRKLRKMIPEGSRQLLGEKSPSTFWKPRFDDLVVWSEKQFKIKLEYIHTNPVRAGLVDIAQNYPYSSAGYWLTGRRGIVEVDREWTWT